MNQKNTFKGDFFWSNNSEEIWTSDMVAGTITELNFYNSFLIVELYMNPLFTYE